MNIEENQISDTELQIEKELAAFRAEEAEKLGLGRGAYKEKVHTTFTAGQVATTTIWVSGLTLAHDHLVAASLRADGVRLLTALFRDGVITLDAAMAASTSPHDLMVELRRLGLVA